VKIELRLGNKIASIREQKATEFIRKRSLDMIQNSWSIKDLLTRALSGDVYYRNDLSLKATGKLNQS